MPRCWRTCSRLDSMHWTLPANPGQFKSAWFRLRSTGPRYRIVTESTNSSWLQELYGGIVIIEVDMQPDRQPTRENWLGRKPGNLTIAFRESNLVH